MSFWGDATDTLWSQSGSQRLEVGQDATDMEGDNRLPAFFAEKEGHIVQVVHHEVLGEDGRHDGAAACVVSRLWKPEKSCIFTPTLKNSVELMLKRRISDFFLLSVVLPMVFLAPFHHHDSPAPSDISCEECSHHQPHPGHLSEKPGTDECLICQLLAQVYIPTIQPAVNRLSSGCVTIDSNLSGDVILSFTHQSCPRAPPVSFCF